MKEKVKKKIKMILSAFVILAAKTKTIANAISFYGMDYEHPIYSSGKKAGLLEASKKQSLYKMSGRIDVIKNIIIPVVFLIIGMGVLFSKKLSSKKKRIILVVFAIILIVSTILINKYIDSEKIASMFVNIPK